MLNLVTMPSKNSSTTPIGPVALLGDMHLGDIVDALAALEPAGVALGEFLVALVLALLGLAALVIILLAEDEHHHIGILLDRAGLAQIGELGALVLALLDGAGELGERQHRHVELLGDGLQAAGDLGDLLHAVLAAHARRAAHELDIVDDDHAAGRGGASGAGRGCAWPAP